MAPEKEPKPDKDPLEAVRSKLAPGKPKLSPNWFGAIEAKPETPEVKKEREARRRKEADKIAMDLLKEKEPGLMEKIKQGIKAAIEFLDQNPQAFLNDEFILERENTTIDELKQDFKRVMEEKSAELSAPKEAIAIIIASMVADMLGAKSFEKFRHLIYLRTFRKVSINYDHGNIDFSIVDNQGNQETILKGPFITAEKIDKTKKDLQALLEVLS